MYPIPSAVCRSKEHILLGLMPLHRCGIAHKPVSVHIMAAGA